MKHLRSEKPISRKVVTTVVIETLVVAWWGGLAGWVINFSFPDLVARAPELLGVVAAVLGRGGLTVTRDMVISMVGQAFKIDLRKADDED